MIVLFTLELDKSCFWECPSATLKWQEDFEVYLYAACDLLGENLDSDEVTDNTHL